MLISVKKKKQTVGQAVESELNKHGLTMDIECELNKERAKVEALEKLLAEACNALVSLKRNGAFSSPIDTCSTELRDFYGSYRAKQNRELEQKTSGEAWKV